MPAKLIALLGTFSVLALAYGLDAWLERARLLAASALNTTLMRLIFWGHGLANVLLAALVLLLTWWIYACTGRGRLLPLLLIAIGLPVALILGVFWSTVPWINWPFTPTPVMIGNSRFSLTGAGLAVLGVALLLRRGPSPAAPPSSNPPSPSSSRG